MSTESFALFTDDGEWLGTEVTSVKELQTWWAERNGAPWWGINTDVTCRESLFEPGSHATADTSTGQSPLCANADCSAAHGTRKRPWNGSVDGHLVNEFDEPHWVSHGEYGGQCSCTEPQPATSATSTPDTWWTCKSDACMTPMFPDAHLDESGKSCVCPTPETDAGDLPPYTTGISYKHPNAPPTCVADACNPNGVNVGTADVKCEEDADCGGVCKESQCYIPNGELCRTDVECSAPLLGITEKTATCVIPEGNTYGIGTCAVLDVQRARMGSTCTQDSHCNLGACAGEEGSKTCTGGCACAPGFVQVTDGGASPLGYTCVDECVGKCKNGGLCVHLPEGGTECRCSPYNGGENCETSLCSREFEFCEFNADCCGHCPCYETECCNKFPLETPYAISCINNVCQEDTTPGGRICHSAAEGCGPAAELGVYTDTPPDCAGWGMRNADGECECHPTHIGADCEIPICARQHETCQVDSECCNSCDFAATNLDMCPLFDTHAPYQACIEGTCKPVDAGTDTVDTSRPCHVIGSGAWTISVDPTQVTDFKEYSGSSILYNKVLTTANNINFTTGVLGTQSIVSVEEETGGLRVSIAITTRENVSAGPIDIDVPVARLIDDFFVAGAWINDEGVPCFPEFPLVHPERPNTFLAQYTQPVCNSLSTGKWTVAVDPSKLATGVKTYTGPSSAVDQPLTPTDYGWETPDLTILTTTVTTIRGLVNVEKEDDGVRVFLTIGTLTDPKNTGTFTFTPQLEDDFYVAGAYADLDGTICFPEVLNTHPTNAGTYLNVSEQPEEPEEPEEPVVEGPCTLLTDNPWMVSVDPTKLAPNVLEFYGQNVVANVTFDNVLSALSDEDSWNMVGALNKNVGDLGTEIRVARATAEGVDLVVSVGEFQLVGNSDIAQVVWFVPFLEDEFFVPGGYVSNGELCLPDTYVENPDSPETFLLVSSLAEVPSLEQCFSLGSYMAISIDPAGNPTGLDNYPDVPVAADPQNPLMQGRHVDVDGVRRTTFRLEPVPGLEHAAVMKSTNDFFEHSHIEGDVAVRIKFLDLVLAGWQTQPGVLVEIATGIWEFGSSGELQFTAVHLEEWTIDNAYMYNPWGDALDVRLPQNNQICLPGSRSESPDSPLTFIEFA